MPSSTARALLGTSLALLLSSCTSVHQSTTDRGFLDRYSEYDYCEVPVVLQKSRADCGTAAAESVIKYWDSDERGGGSDEIKLGDSRGALLSELQSALIARQLKAYAVRLDPRQPLNRVHHEILRGRPVILPLECPTGRYFGPSLPVIGHLDGEVVRLDLLTTRHGLVPFYSSGESLKEHFVVALGCSKDGGDWLVMDPAYGIVSVSKGRLERFWKAKGFAALLCSP